MKRVFCLFLSMVVLSVGLAYLRQDAAFRNETGDEKAVSYTASGQTIRMQEGQDIEISKKTSVIYEAGELTDENSRSLKQKQEDSYSYARLNEKEQEIYIEILWALQELKENVKLSSLDNEEISRIFQCVLNDHPEIFYVNGYTYTQYTLADIIKKITFTGTYNRSMEEIERRKTLIDSYVNQCFEDMPSDADEYEKVKYIYEYLINNTEYDDSSEDNQNICSVFLDRKSVCQGYAKATQYLLQQAGIKAALVLGKVSAGEGHAWNLVNIDEEWYYLDTTWGDASYQAVGKGETQSGDKIPTINYDYLCVTTDQLSKTHTIDNVVELPICNSMKNNYYVREGLYFTTVDEERLTDIFRDSYDKGKAYVTLKCASKEIYDEFYRLLIKEQGIFGYLDCPDGVVSYSDNEVQYSMSFWL